MFDAIYELKVLQDQGIKYILGQPVEVGEKSQGPPMVKSLNSVNLG